jgi:hypothetical protein
LAIDIWKVLKSSVLEFISSEIQSLERGVFWIRCLAGHIDLTLRNPSKAGYFLCQREAADPPYH